MAIDIHVACTRKLDILADVNTVKKANTTNIGYHHCVRIRYL